MSEIEKAIEVLTDKHTQIGTTAPNDTAWRLLKPAMNTAIAALQEKLERDKGCDLCNSEYCGTCIKQLDYYGNGKFDDKCSAASCDTRCVAYKPMGCCPVCGKKLGEERQ